VGEYGSRCHLHRSVVIPLQYNYFVADDGDPSGVLLNLSCPDDIMEMMRHDDDARVRDAAAIFYPLVPLKS